MADVQRKSDKYGGRLGPVIRKHREQIYPEPGPFAVKLGYTNSSRSDNGNLRASEAYNNLEKGKNDPTLSKLFELCEYLGPDFVDDVADQLFEAAKLGLRKRRDEEMERAKQVLIDATNQHSELRDSAEKLGEKSRQAKRRPAPAMVDD